MTATLLRLTLCTVAAVALAPGAKQASLTRRSLGAKIATLALAFPTGARAYARPGVDGDDVGGVETAYFSGGDPRLLAPAFDALLGVFSAETGTMKDGTKALSVSYDPTVASYGRLLGQYWRAIDPTAAQGQFTEEGAQFRTVIYPTDKRKRKTAEASLRKLEETGLFGFYAGNKLVGKRVATEVAILPLGGEREYGYAPHRVWVQQAPGAPKATPPAPSWGYFGDDKQVANLAASLDGGDASEAKLRAQLAARLP